MKPAAVVSYAVYAVAIEVVVWTVLLPITLCRVLAGRASRAEWRARMAWTPPTSPGGVLIHAVSAGEMRAASALLGREWLPERVILSTGTAAGMTVARELASTRAATIPVFLPWDRFAIRRWLSTTGVAAVVVTETELWPSLFFACRALGLPLFVVSARLRPGDTRRYRLARWFFGAVLDCVTWIGTQEESGRDAFIAIGARAQRVEVAGNLKSAAAATSREIASPIVRHLETGPLFIAGSTHDPEELLLLDEATLLRQRFGMRMVIAPRDVRRAPAICRHADSRGLAAVRWSTLSGNAGAVDWNVLVVDEFGWLPALYHFAEVVLVGGTIAPIGGHNIIEPLRAGCRLIVGAHTSEIEPMLIRLTGAATPARLPASPRQGDIAGACAMLLDAPATPELRDAVAVSMSADEARTLDRYDRAIAARLG